MNSIALILLIVCYVSWTIAYVSIVIIGLRQKTFGMPAVSLFLNLGWELLYAYLGCRTNVFDLSTIGNMIWLLLDIFILYTYIKYGKQSFEAKVGGSYFFPWIFFMLLVGGVLQYRFKMDFGLPSSENFQSITIVSKTDLGSWYAAFIMNLIMSILFIDMLSDRRSSKGQSMTIAYAKLVGTMTQTVLFGVLLQNKLVLSLGIFCLCFDIAYVYLLAQMIKNESKTTDRRIVT